MRTLLFLLLACLLLLSLAEAKRKKHHRKDKDAANKDELDMIAEDEDFKNKEAPIDNVIEGGYSAPGKSSKKNPCSTKHCGAGRECEIDETGEAQCVCVKKCTDESDERRRVCSNHNETWNSDCHLYQMRCYCKEGNNECSDIKMEHVHVDYYGECRELPVCTKEEMDDFPRRMREWLFNVMKDLAQRKELVKPYKEMEEEAEVMQSKRWVNAAVWKFCDLDVHPHDRKVSRHELFPLRAPLLSMEPCIAGFLDACDPDDDHKISLAEWGKCLQLQPDEMEHRCADLAS